MFELTLFSYEANNKAFLCVAKKSTSTVCLSPVLCHLISFLHEKEKGWERWVTGSCAHLEQLL